MSIGPVPVDQLVAVSVGSQNPAQVSMSEPKQNSSWRYLRHYESSQPARAPWPGQSIMVTPIVH